MKWAYKEQYKNRWSVWEPGSKVVEETIVKEIIVKNFPNLKNSWWEETWEHLYREGNTWWYWCWNIVCLKQLSCKQLCNSWRQWKISWKNSKTSFLVFGCSRFILGFAFGSFLVAPISFQERMASNLSTVLSLVLLS